MKKSDLTLNPLLINQYLPHNFLAEKIVLSSLLNSSEALDLTLNHLTIETFYFKNHQEIYKAIIDMSKKNISIDILTLTTFLKDNGVLDKIGGLKVLSEFLNQLPNIQYLKEYIKLIQDKFLRRTLIQLGYRIINSCYITSIPLENILNDLETEVLNITTRNQTQNFLSSTQLFTNILFELKQKSIQPILPGLSSGFYDLDSITQGFQKSDLIIIAGRPSIGKTAFCLNITINIIKKYNLPILFFSLEMSKEQLIYRLLSSESGISNLRLRSGNISKEDWLTLNNIITTFSSLPLFIDDSANLSTTNIRKKVKKIIFEQAQIGLIVIDYLQLMQNSTHSITNRTQELGLITRSLKILAREFKIPIITLSQLSRNVENRINKRPILADLRESGSIEQDADLVLMLYRDNYYNFVPTEFQTAELIIAKHRNGPTGTIKLQFQEKLAKFIEINSSN